LGNHQACLPVPALYATTSLRWAKPRSNSGVKNSSAVRISWVAIAATPLCDDGCARLMAIARDISRKCMSMVVTVAVEPETRCGFGAEQPHIFRMARHGTWYALAANMAIETDHTVAGAKHHLQIMGNEQDTATAPRPDRSNQLVKLGRAGKVD